MINIMAESADQRNNNALLCDSTASKMNDSFERASTCDSSLNDRNQQSLHLSLGSLFDDTAVDDHDDDGMDCYHMTRVQYNWLDLLYIEPEDSLSTNHTRAQYILVQKADFDDKHLDEKVDDTMSCSDEDSFVSQAREHQEISLGEREEIANNRARNFPSNDTTKEQS